MRQLDFYEFAGVLLPGVVLLTAMGLVFPEKRAELIGGDLSVGDLGWTTMLAYVLGHLLQGVGNLIEKAYWGFWGGMPTDWIRSRRRPLIAGQQAQLLQENLRKLLADEAFELTRELESHQWYSLTRQLYAHASDSGLAQRVDVFNGNYGLFRGLVAAFLLVLIVVVVRDWTDWQAELFLIGLITVSLYRMHRFGVLYARELFVQFIQASIKTETKNAG
jgi:hypothetical protein